MRLLIDLEALQHPARFLSAGSLLTPLVPALIDAALNQGMTPHLLANTAHTQTIAPLQRQFAAQHTAGRLHLFDAPSQAELASYAGLLKAFSIAGLGIDTILDSTVHKAGSEAVAASKIIEGAIHRLSVENFANKYLVFKPLCGTPRHPAKPEDTPYGAFGKPSVLQQKARKQAYRHLNLFRPYLLFVGGPGNDAQLDVALLLQAYADLPAPHRPQLDLVLAGDFDATSRQTLRAMATKLGLDPHSVHLLAQPTQENTHRLIVGATLMVDLTTAKSPSGHVLAALEAHVPVVSPDTAAHRAALGSAEALFDAAAPQALSECLNRLLSNSEAFDALCAAQIAQAQVVAWPETAKRMLDAFAAPAKPLKSEHVDWPTLQKRLDGLEAQTIHTLNIAAAQAHLDETTLAYLARAVVATRAEIENAHRGHGFAAPAPPRTWRIEGPFDSSYSLAAVNRETARALDRKGWPVALFSAEGPGPYAPDTGYLKDHPDLEGMRARADSQSEAAADITSRNMFPPRCDDMVSRVNLLHGYAWEETGFPAAYARDINRHLQGLLVTSPHVAQVLTNAGISVPISVVGNGVEHIDLPPAPLPFALPEAKFRILHVSSCFPRKGADVLLAAFAEAFANDADAARDVCLVIKTHANPHNTIEAEVAALRSAHPVLPQIVIETTDLSPPQMRALYEAADLLVAPSRAEGFCLPVAEAVLAGTPVITTGWSGQLIFKPNPLITFTDYDFSEAGSHLETSDSIWAEPRVGDLAAQLVTAYKSPPPSPEKALDAARVLRAKHSWSEVARRSTRAVHDIVKAVPRVPARIGWVSTFNTRCGIATYSAHLLAGLPDSPLILANHTDDTLLEGPGAVLRCWTEGKQDPLDRLYGAIKEQNLRTIVIQFNYGFYSFAALARLIRRLKTEGRKVVLMMHATDDGPHEAHNQLSSFELELALCDRLLVHSVHDLNRLKALGLVDNVALFPHGVLEVPQRPAPVLRPDAPFVIGTYGFLLPPKGFPELIEAVGLMRDAGRDVALRMINAQYPVPQSAALVAEVKTQIAARGLNDHVDLCTDFLEDDESLERLSEAHLLAFPYRPTSESASGAVRQALAISRPIAVTPLPIFDDVRGLVLALPGFSPPEIAEGLSAIMDEMQVLPAEGPVAQSLARGTGWRQATGYGPLSHRLWALLQAI